MWSRWRQPLDRAIAALSPPSRRPSPMPARPTARWPVASVPTCSARRFSRLRRAWRRLPGAGASREAEESGAHEIHQWPLRDCPPAYGDVSIRRPGVLCACDAAAARRDRPNGGDASAHSPKHAMSAHFRTGRTATPARKRCGRSTATKRPASSPPSSPITKSAADLYLGDGDFEDMTPEAKETGVVIVGGMKTALPLSWRRSG